MMHSFILRSSFVLGTVTVSLAAFAAGCTVQASVKTQTKFVDAGSSTKQTSNAYAGETIEVTNANGSVIVMGDSSTTNVSVATSVFAFADDKAKSDADSAIALVKETFTLDESVPGKITIRCGQASHAVGTAAPGTTGCESFTVKVPAAAVAITVLASNGGLTASNLTAASGTSVTLRSANGEVDATGITGSADVQSDNGDVSASLTPTAGATIKVATGNGDIALRLPGDFGAKALALSAGKGVTVSGFADLTATSTSHNASSESAAASVTATASELGTLSVTPQ